MPKPQKLIFFHHFFTFEVYFKQKTPKNQILIHF